MSVRLSPNSIYNSMSDSHPEATSAYVAERLNQYGLAYLHVIEPRVKGNETLQEDMAPVAAEQLRKVFKGNILVVGGFDADSAEAIVEKGIADLVAFGRCFIAAAPWIRGAPPAGVLNDHPENQFPNLLRYRSSSNLPPDSGN